MTDILQKITAYKLVEIAAAKEACPLSALTKRARAAPPVRPFAGAIEAKLADWKERIDRRDQEGVTLEGPDP